MVPFGKFGRPHGVRGDLRFWPHNPQSELLKVGRRICVGRSNADVEEHELTFVRFDARGAIVGLASINDRDEAASLTGHFWYEARESFPEPEADEIYLSDLIGLKVRTEEGLEVGHIKDVLTLGPSDILVIGSGGQTSMVPNVPDFVIRMDLEAGEVVIRPIEGLLDV
jgi:16S rRNA processing protein RimM